MRPTEKPVVSRRSSRPNEKDSPVIRIVRLLPLVIPVVRRILRNPSVRARLGSKPPPAQKQRGRK